MKTALVTGGAGGIGEAICRRFAAAGYRVVLHYFSSESRAINVLSELNSTVCIKHLAVKADITNRAQVEQLFQAAGNVDVLVNNAGIAQQKLFTDISVEDWRRMFAVDVDGVFHCCQCALPYMIHQKAGSIINISSMWGQVGASCEVHYSAAKAAIIGLTKALAKELGPSYIRVNCIAPGVIDTPMNGHLSSEVMQELQEETPLQAIGTPQDIAEAVLFFASDRAKFITGQVLGVNGGFII